MKTECIDNTTEMTYEESEQKAKAKGGRLMTHDELGIHIQEAVTSGYMNNVDFKGNVAIR